MYLFLFSQYHQAFIYLMLLCTNVEVLRPCVCLEMIVSQFCNLFLNKLVWRSEGAKKISHITHSFSENRFELILWIFTNYKTVEKLRILPGPVFLIWIDVDAPDKSFVSDAVPKIRTVTCFVFLVQPNIWRTRVSMLTGLLILNIQWPYNPNIWERFIS